MQPLNIGASSTDNSDIQKPTTEISNVETSSRIYQDDAPTLRVGCQVDLLDDKVEEIGVENSG